MNEVSGYTRPLGTIKGRDDVTIASIIIYDNGKVKKKEEIPDYLDGLNSKVQSPIAEGVKTKKPGDIPMLNLDGHGNRYYGIFNNFILSNVTESTGTISKMHMNFSDSWNVFFFNQSPTQIQFTGGFIDTEEFPYYQEFMTAYDKYLSGPQLTKHNRRMLISYDGKVVDGFITSISVSSDSMSEGYKAFQISILAKSISWNRSNMLRDEIKFDKTTRGGEENYNALSNIGRLHAENEYIPNMDTQGEGRFL